MTPPADAPDAALTPTPDDDEAQLEQLRLEKIRAGGPEAVALLAQEGIEVPVLPDPAVEADRIVAERNAAREAARDAEGV